MSVSTLSRSAIREYDRRAIEEYGVPGVVLMENAGRGVAELMLSLSCSGPVDICCGPGNNGGDGFVIARHLQRNGIEAKLHCWQPIEDWTGDAGINALIANRCGIGVSFHKSQDWPKAFAASLLDAEWIVDALLGTGATGNPRSPFDRAITTMNAARGLKLAVDIPSGLDCDIGTPAEPTFRADHTCTFVAAKPGLIVPAARSVVGQLHIIDIGAPQKLFEEMVRT